MEHYIINVGNIEEMQLLNDQPGLDSVFAKAKSNIVCGGKVILERKDLSGRSYQFEEFTTLEDLSVYKKNVYKLLS